MQSLNDPKQVLEMALENELKGREILEGARESVQNPLAKATFEFLANEELKHIDLIEQFAAALTGGDVPNVDDLSVLTASDAKQHIKSIFERFRIAFEAAAATDDPRMEAYRVAEDMERQGHDFYHRAAEQATDENAKKMYQFLAQEEIRHFELIQDTHDYLQQPDALMAVEERWMQT